MTATATLRKLALKRDPNVPVGQPAPMHLDCPCGTQIAVNADVMACSGCGSEYNSMGWKLEPKLTPGVAKATNGRPFIVR